MRDFPVQTAILVMTVASNARLGPSSDEICYYLLA